MKCLDTDWDLTEGFSTWNRVLGGFLFYPFLFCTWSQYISQQRFFHIAFLPCFTYSRQTLGLMQEIHSVQMRELFGLTNVRTQVNHSFWGLSFSTDYGTDVAAGTPASTPAGSDV